MKNSQKGFVIPLLVIAIAVVTIGAGVYYISFRKDASLKYSSPIPTQPSQPQQNSDIPTNTPQNVGGNSNIKINSLTPATVAIGDSVTIAGKGFSGHDTLVWISRGDAKAILWGGMPQSDSVIVVKITSQFCTKYTGASGLPCPSTLTVSSGTYGVYAENQNGKSNSVYLTINGGNVPSATGDIKISVLDGAAFDSPLLVPARVELRIGQKSITSANTVNGIATFTKLPVGSYVAHIKADGYKEADLNFTVKQGDNGYGAAISLQKF